MTSGELVAAKFRMAAWSVLSTWVLIALWWITVAKLRGDSIGIDEFKSTLLLRYPGYRALALLALGAIVAPALTWKLMTDFVTPCLAGRVWVETVTGVAWVACFSIFVVVTMTYWGYPEDRNLARFFNALPWLVIAAAILKGAIAAWAFRAAWTRGLITLRYSAGALALWLTLVACAAGFTTLAIGASTVHVSGLFILVGVAVVMPLARFALAPLALDWNRHR